MQQQYHDTLTGAAPDTVVSDPAALLKNFDEFLRGPLDQWLRSFRSDVSRWEPQTDRRRAWTLPWGTLPAVAKSMSIRKSPALIAAIIRVTGKHGVPVADAVRARGSVTFCLGANSCHLSSRQAVG